MVVCIPKFGICSRIFSCMHCVGVEEIMESFVFPMVGMHVGQALCVFSC